MKLMHWWRRLRQRYWLSLAMDAVLILLVFFAIHSWQTRNLPMDVPVQDAALSRLHSGELQPLLDSGQAGIVYFFAPWCGYCRHSIGNLDSLVESGRVPWARAVALSWGDAGEVADFVEETGISLDVLMGDESTARQWAVTGFPTYFVIDESGRISSRSVGYSTYLGMWMRVLFRT